MVPVASPVAAAWSRLPFLYAEPVGTGRPVDGVTSQYQWGRVVRAQFQPQHSHVRS